jgi:yecA family protein
MRQKYRQGGRYGQTVPLLLPPNLQTLGTLPFSAQHFAELDAWLAQDGWPPDRMDVAMLEGYLAALLAWPIKLSPGAWLPQIWGIRGWKVAAKIATEEKYNRFIELVMGMLQDLERRLLTSPPVQTAVLAEGTPYLSGRYFAGAAWATGFMIALHENSTGLGTRSAGVRTAVEDIARHASRRSSESSELPPVATELKRALMVILAERSYGPVERVPLNKATLLRSTSTPAERRQRRSA